MARCASTWARRPSCWSATAPRWGARARRWRCCAAAWQPDDVAAAVRRTGARAVSAHNLNPAFGWRALAAARGGGRARRAAPAQLPPGLRGGDVLQQPRRGLRALPGPQHAARRAPELPRHRRRGGRLRRVAGAVAAARWRRRPTRSSCRRASRRERLRELRAPLDPARVHVVPHVVRAFAERLAGGGRRARARRLAAGAREGRRGRDPGVRAGGPAARRGRRRPAGRGAARRGRRRASWAACRREELADLRARAALAIVPSRSAETFGLAAAEAMAAGVPVVASAIGALPELVGADGLVAPGDADALAAAARGALRRRGGGRAPGCGASASWRPPARWPRSCGRSTEPSRTPAPARARRRAGA